VGVDEPLDRVEVVAVGAGQRRQPLVAAHRPGQRLGDHRDLEPRRHPQVEVEILGGAQRRVEAAGRGEHLAAQHRRRRRQRRVAQHVRQHPAVDRDELAAAEDLEADPVGVHALDVGDDHADLGPARQQLDLAGDLGRPPLVVVVEQRQVRAGGRGHAVVARRRHAAVGLLQVAHPVAELGAHPGGAVVGAAVVDDDDLQRLGRVGLRDDRRQREAQVGRALVGRDDRGDPRRSHVALLLAPRDRSTR
jgi:hypothetical protein